MSVSAHRRLPLRVTLAHECELVSAGFVGLMAPYGPRVRVVPSRGGLPARDVDLTLHDMLASVYEIPLASVPAIAHDGLLVAWTWNARPELVEMALANGVSGVLSKTLPASRLLAALESIHRGRRVVDLGDVTPIAPVTPVAPVVQPLTRREAEVIAMITQGHSNQQIAAEAAISINSLKSYIRSAYRKMGVTSRSQAVLWGVRHGCLGPAGVDDDRELTSRVLGLSD